MREISDAEALNYLVAEERMLKEYAFALHWPFRRFRQVWLTIGFVEGWKAARPVDDPDTPDEGQTKGDGA